MHKVTPSKVTISQSYQKKESVRQRLQDIIENSISDGEVSNQSQLEEFIQVLRMSLDALKMVPFDVYQKSSTRLK